MEGGLWPATGNATVGSGESVLMLFHVFEIFFLRSEILAAARASVGDKRDG